MAILSLHPAPTDIEVTAVIREAGAAAPPGVKPRKFELSEDWSGDPAVYPHYTSSKKLPSHVLQELAPDGFSSNLREFCSIFVRLLQDARHQAEYDLHVAFSRGPAKGFWVRAQHGFALWQPIRSSGEGHIFLSASLFAGLSAR